MQSKFVNDQYILFQHLSSHEIQIKIVAGLSSGAILAPCKIGVQRHNAILTPLQRSLHHKV